MQKKLFLFRNFAKFDIKELKIELKAKTERIKIGLTAKMNNKTLYKYILISDIKNSQKSIAYQSYKLSKTRTYSRQNKEYIYFTKY